MGRTARFLVVWAVLLATAAGAANIDSYAPRTGRMIAESGTVVNIADLLSAGWGTIGAVVGTTANINKYSPISGRWIKEDGSLVNIADLFVASGGLAGKPAQTVTVAKSGGNYTTITAALAAITDASATKPYQITVNPGVYDEAITMKAFVSVVGTDRDACIIGLTTTDTYPIVAMATDSKLSNLTIRCLKGKATDPGTPARVIAMDAVSRSVVQGCSIVGGNWGIKATGDVTSCKNNVIRGNHFDCPQMFYQTSGRLNVLAQNTQYYVDKVWRCHGICDVDSGDQLIVTGNRGYCFSTIAGALADAYGIRIGGDGGNVVMGNTAWIGTYRAVMIGICVQTQANQGNLKSTVQDNHVYMFSMHAAPTLAAHIGTYSYDLVNLRKSHTVRFRGNTVLYQFSGGSVAETGYYEPTQINNGTPITMEVDEMSCPQELPNSLANSVIARYNTPGFQLGQDLVGTPTFSLGGTSVDNIRTVTVTLKDKAGSAIAVTTRARIWVSDVAGGAPSATGVTSVVADTSGGTITETEIAACSFQWLSVVTSGVCLVKIDADATLGLNKYVNVEYRGKVTSSAVVVFNEV